MANGGFYGEDETRIRLERLHKVIDSLNGKSMFALKDGAMIITSEEVKEILSLLSDNERELRRML